MDFTTYEPRISALEAGGSGGGSSDFSTAEVTINNTQYEGGITFHAPFIDDGVIYREKVVFYEATQTISVILFQGMSGEVFSSIDGPDGPENVDASSVTGGIEQEGDGLYSITGDGTITF